MMIFFLSIIDPFRSLPEAPVVPIGSMYEP
jgi:hypothetical protein